MNDEKKFVKPTAEIVDFTNQDIITDSLVGASEAGWNDGYGEDF